MTAQRGTGGRAHSCDDPTNHRQERGKQAEQSTKCQGCNACHSHGCDAFDERRGSLRIVYLGGDDRRDDAADSCCFDNGDSPCCDCGTQCHKGSRSNYETSADSDCTGTQSENFAGVRREAA